MSGGWIPDAQTEALLAALDAVNVQSAGDFARFCASIQEKARLPAVDRESYIEGARDTYQRLAAAAEGLREAVNALPEVIVRDERGWPDTTREYVRRVDVISAIDALVQARRGQLR